MGRSVRIIFWLFGLSLVSIAAHNAIFGLWKIEEPYLSITGLVLFIVFALAVIWNSIIYMRFRKPVDLWKIGFIGIFGLLGLIPTIGPEFFVFFVLFALFLLRR